MTEQTSETMPAREIKEIEVDGYSFKVDTDLIDDVETLEIVGRIEEKGSVSSIVALLRKLLGEKEYQKMKVAYSKLDAEAHAEKYPDDKDYSPRFRIEQLQNVYLAIIEKFDPKG